MLNGSFIIIIFFFFRKVDTSKSQVTSTRARGPTTAQLDYCDGPNKENQRHSVIKKELCIIEHNFLWQFASIILYGNSPLGEL